MLALKAALPAYPDLTHAEDSSVINRLQQRSRVALLDMPRLYVYAFHGRNAWAADHFESQWRRCSSRYMGERYDAVLDELGRRLPIAVYQELLARSREAAPPGGSRLAGPSGSDQRTGSLRTSA